MKPEEKHQITVQKDGKTVENIKPERISYVIEDIGYWRKANAIHKWFVDNTQDGDDKNGEESYVSRAKLVQLLELCNKVLESSKLVSGKIETSYTFTPEGKRKPILTPGKIIKDPIIAKELLPTQEGFFFGSTGYDQYYIEDIQYTKELLEKVLAEPEDGEIYYHSSW